MRNQSIVLGIDLGTSFSTACIWMDQRCHFMTDGRGEARIPSVVYFPRSGPPVVGAEADRMRATDPVNTIFGIKRLLGCKSKTSGAARLIDAIAPYKLSDDGSGEISVSVRGRAYHASELAAIILRYLKDRAEIRFGRGITKAVMTHPVNASAEAIQATIHGAKLAGLEVLRTLAEPCAGMLASGVGAEPTPRRWLVYDFGGGTLDITTIEQSGSAFRVLSAGGDELLGGDDFDRALADRVADLVWRVRRLELRRDVVRWEELHRQVERAKKALSVQMGARIFLEDLPSSSEPRFELILERKDADETWKELVDRSIEHTANTMLAAGLKPRDLTAVIPIGGTSYIPMIKNALSRVFPGPRVQVADPQTVVAAGAAMLAAGAVDLRDR